MQPWCVIHKLIAEVISELGLTETTVGVSPVGCAVFAYNYIDVDWVEAAHGRAPAVATALKRLWPENTVFTYQGDGDMSAITAPLKVYTPPTVAKTLLWSLLTMLSTA